MGKQYRHLSIDEREQIAQLRNECTGLSEIALQLGRDKGTISRELKRNGAPLYNSYTPCRAQYRSDQRRREGYIQGSENFLFILPDSVLKHSQCFNAELHRAGFP